MIFMEKQKKKKVNLDLRVKRPSVIDAIMLEEMCRWEDKFLSKKAKKESLKGFG